MDGHHGLDRCPERIVSAPEMNIGSCQGRVPVVYIDDLNRKFQMLDGRQSGLTEKNKPLAIVEIIALGRTIIMTTIKILTPIDEINRQPLVVGQIDIR